MPSNRRRPQVTVGAKAVLALFASAVLAAGLYLGYQLSRPPAKPELADLAGGGSNPADPPAPRPSAPTSKPTPDPAAEATPSTGTLDGGDAESPAARETGSDGAAVEIRRQPPPGPWPGGAPRVAIVIDDLGRSVKDVRDLGALGVPLSYAVLPYEARTEAVVAELQRRGDEILCHLPMEPQGGNDPGPGALSTSMSAQQIADATRRAIEAVPGAVGVNNHMGSALVADRDAMSAVLGELARRNLFFVDSRTTADTVAYSLARQLGVPAGERQVFLDNDREVTAIRSQFAELLRQAEARGGALGIAHPYPETLEALAAEIPAARSAGYAFVTASQLLDGGR
ncbi:MAG: divergent polysaccharide deacetylase family protein [Acidobacteriota bacterium]